MLWLLSIVVFATQKRFCMILYKFNYMRVRGLYFRFQLNLINKGSTKEQIMKQSNGFQTIIHDVEWLTINHSLVTVFKSFGSRDTRDLM